jgi:hypothetical protein
MASYQNQTTPPCPRYFPPQERVDIGVGPWHEAGDRKSTGGSQKGTAGFLTRGRVGASLLVGAGLIAVGMFLPWQRTVEQGGQTSTQSGVHLAGATLLIIAAAMAVFAAAFLTGRGGTGLKVIMLFVGLICLVSVLLAVNAIGLPETTDIISFSFDIGFYMIAAGTVVLLAGTVLAFKEHGPRRPDAEATP